MNETMIVKELSKTDRDRLDERKITYKAVLEGKEIKVMIISENPLELKKRDEVVIKKIKAQKKL